MPTETATTTTRTPTPRTTYRAWGASPKSAFTLNQLRKSDLANREQHEVELRWNLLLRDDMDLAVAGRFRADEYGSAYGLESERTGSVNADWSYAFSQNFSAHAMGSWEYIERNQRNLNDDLAGIGSPDGDAGGPLYPLANRWQLGSTQNAFFAGAGFTWRFLERVTLQADYQMIHTRQRMDYDFASDGALFLVPGSEAGHRYPNLESVDHVLQSSLRVQLMEHLAVRVFHRYSARRDRRLPAAKPRRSEPRQRHARCRHRRALPGTPRPQLRRTRPRRDASAALLLSAPSRYLVPVLSFSIWKVRLRRQMLRAEKGFLADDCRFHRSISTRASRKASRDSSGVGSTVGSSDAAGVGAGVGTA